MSNGNKEGASAPLGGQAKPVSLAIPAALVIGGGVVYGSLFAANKIAIEAGFPFIAYTFWQTLFAGAALLLFAAVRSDLPRLSFHHLRHYFLTSALGIVVPVLVLTYIADKLPAGVVTLIIALAPPLTYVFAFLLRRERFRWLSVGGVAFGFTGVLLIVLPEGTLPSPEAAVWMIVALLVPLSLATNSMVLALLRPPEATTVSLVCGLLLAGAVTAFIVMVAQGGATDTGSGFWAMVWAAGVQLIAFITILEVVRLAGPVYMTQVNYVIVGAGFLWALALFDEALSIWVWAALAAVLVGLALAQAGAVRARREEQA